MPVLEQQDFEVVEDLHIEGGVTGRERVLVRDREKKRIARDRLAHHALRLGHRHGQDP